ncbi:hypothetical protein FHW71_003765 [Enterobacter sp. Sphag1F]|nr:hypothetical protein [Enterobacter sp. Sphag1F]NYI16218.1 hypothetical protein [Enterobacter sp. Sphag71]
MMRVMMKIVRSAVSPCGLAQTSSLQVYSFQIF